MQKSDPDQEGNKIPASSHFMAKQACPQCGNGKTRRSLTKSSDGLLINLFCKVYRCQGCRHRFWVLNPMRLIWLTGILVLFIPFLGALWMAAKENPIVVSSVEAVSGDQIKQLAESGDAEAELKMGLRHTSTARGVKNDRIAVQWFERAAQHGQVDAQYRYGSALLNGEGIVQDYKTAFYWLEKAAQQGHAQAQYKLGDMYYSGIAIGKDTERAYLWFNLAAAQGIESAASNRDIVVKLLTPNQIAALQQEAGRINNGYHSTATADESKSGITESDSADVGGAPTNEPTPVEAPPATKPLLRTLKDWWKENLQ